MADIESKRLRLRFPDGSEFEAAGSDEFIHEHLNKFIERRSAPLEIKESRANAEIQNNEPQILWDEIIESGKKDILLRAKLGRPGDKKEACLILIAASHQLLGNPKPSAIELARWLRKSGYPLLRIDRILQDAATQGEILASGSRRSRRYELSPKGKIKALLLAEKLTAAITQDQ